jgi:GntR family transcriptional regulator / MocR family aminotransferase
VALHAAKFVSDWHTSLPTQAALADFIDQGALAGHLRRVRRQYGLRHHRIATALAGPLARWLEVIPSVAGLHIGAYLKQDPGPGLTAFLDRAYSAGVALFDFAHVAWLGNSRPGLVFGYGAIPVDRIDDGLCRIEDCLRDATPRPSPGRGHRAVRSTPR